MTRLLEHALTLGAATLTVDVVQMWGAPATLVGGALIAAASSNPTLPRRITTEGYTVDMAALPNGSQALGMDFTSDSLGVVVSWASNFVARINFKTATVVWATSVASIHGVSRTDTAMNVGRTASNTTWYQFDESTGAQTTRVKSTGLHRQVLSVPGGTPDRAWIHAGGTTATEIIISTGAATGRTITSAGNISSMSVSQGDGTPKLYIQNAIDLRAYRESDLALIDTWTVSGIPGSPGGNVGTEMYVHPLTGQPFVRHTNGSLVDRYPTGGGSVATSAVRAIFPGQEIGGMAQGISSTPVFPFMAISPDGKYLAFLQPSADQSLRDRILRVVGIGTHRATWTAALGVAGTLARIPSPGMAANEYGSVPGWRTTTTVDHRRTRWYYQRTGGVSNDAARVEFTPNTSMSVALEAAHTLTVDAGMDVWLKPFSAKPWIGGDRDRDGAGLGEGPSILYTVADINVIPTVAVASKMIAAPTASESLTAVGADADGSVASYAWANVSGPNVATLAGASTATVTASGLIVGEYVIRCTVTDNSGATAVVDGRIFVAAAPLNVIPTVDAGLGAVPVSPTSTATLTSSSSDTDGTIASRLWTQLTGAACTIATPTAASTVVSGLAIGSYSFRCTVTDNIGATASDDVAVTVVAGTAVQYVPTGGGAFRGRLAAQPAFRGRLGTR